MKPGEVLRNCEVRIEEFVDRLMNPDQTDAGWAARKATYEAQINTARGVQALHLARESGKIAAHFATTEADTRAQEA